MTTKKTTVLVVPDMTCGHCEMSLREALDGLDGVEEIRADHVTGRVEIVHDGDRVGYDQFGQTVEDAGYTLKA